MSIKLLWVKIIVMNFNVIIPINNKTKLNKIVKHLNKKKV